MMMENSYVMMTQQTDKELEEYEEACSTSELHSMLKRAVCDLETEVNWWVGESD